MSVLMHDDSTLEFEIDQISISSFISAVACATIYIAEKALNERFDIESEMISNLSFNHIGLLGGLPLLLIRVQSLRLKFTGSLGLDGHSK